jgi:hypothetical protein
MTNGDVQSGQQDRKNLEKLFPPPWRHDTRY